MTEKGNKEKREGKEHQGAEHTEVALCQLGSWRSTHVALAKVSTLTDCMKWRNTFLEEL